MASRDNGNRNNKSGEDDDDEEEEGGEEEEEEERVTAHSYGALDGTPTSTSGNSTNTTEDAMMVQVTDECWLVRVPQALAQAWEDAPEGTNLGDLVFKKGGPVPGPGNKKIQPSFTVHVSEELAVQQQQQRQRQQQSSSVAAAKNPAAAAAASNTTTAASTLPLNYALQAMTKKVPVLHPFIRNPRNGRVQLLGTVSRTANLQVEQDQTYRALCKDRMVATNLTTSRFVKPVESTESVMSKKQQQQKPLPVVASAAAAGIPGGNGGDGSSRKRKTFGDAVFHFGKRMLDAAEKSSQQQRNQLLLQQQAAMMNSKSKGQSQQRQFTADQSLRSVLFELFAHNSYWAVKDLKAAASAGGATHAGTKKGESEIRDILREIGEYHRSGDHKNMWELCTEFQQQG